MCGTSMMPIGTGTFRQISGSQTAEGEFCDDRGISEHKVTVGPGVEPAIVSQSLCQGFVSLEAA
jgi:hypothetical protein